MADDQKNPFLTQAYRLGSQQETKALYKDWADSYDDTMSHHDYQTPQRCADALMRHLSDTSAPIFDVGCGTGISGQALSDAGFTVIDGSDISDEMVAKARSRDRVYRHLSAVSLETPLILAMTMPRLPRWALLQISMHRQKLSLSFCKNCQLAGF